MFSVILFVQVEPYSGTFKYCF